MTIENLKQIAIKYATTKGSRVPLAPDELCNAVVQYVNEFLKITADINTLQVAVTKEDVNIVFTITGNTLDGKAFTPIVITVDHNGFVTNQEFEEFKTSVTKQLNNKRSVISSPASSYVVYTQANGLESNLPYSELANQTSTNIMARRANGTSDVKKGISGENVANMENIADLEEKIPDVTNLATKDELTNLADVTKENTFTDVNHFTQYITSFGVEIGTGNTDDDEYDVSIQESGIEIFHYISGSKANSLRITENKIMTIVYPSNEYNIFGFPNKSGTLALTSDIIKNPIYFISFYANELSEPCHLIGTMMSKNSYGTGQKTNEEFAVMLADNLYTNSNEGLAAYGKLAQKDILCIYSEDGLSIRCLDEENNEVDLPMVIFFVMETEL